MRFDFNSNIAQKSQINNETLSSITYTNTPSLTMIEPNLAQGPNETVQSMDRQHTNVQIIPQQLNPSQYHPHQQLSTQTELPKEEQPPLQQSHSQQPTQFQDHFNGIQELEVIDSSKVSFGPNKIEMNKTVSTSDQQESTNLLESQPRSKEDEDAGRTLLGFLSELRRNHLDAIAQVSEMETSSQSQHIVFPNNNLKEVPKEVPSFSNIQNYKNISPHREQIISSEYETNSFHQLKRTSEVLFSQANAMAPTPDYEVTSANSDGPRVQSFNSTETSSGSTSVPCDLSGGETESNSSNETHSIRDKVSVDYNGCVKAHEESDCVSSSEEIEKRSVPIRKRRKRHILAFTSRNISDHNSRMAVLEENAIQQASSGMNVLGAIAQNKNKGENQK